MALNFPDTWGIKKGWTNIEIKKDVDMSFSFQVRSFFYYVLKVLSTYALHVSLSTIKSYVDKQKVSFYCNTEIDHILVVLRELQKNELVNSKDGKEEKWQITDQGIKALKQIEQDGYLIMEKVYD